MFTRFQCEVSVKADQDNSMTPTTLDSYCVQVLKRLISSNQPLTARQMAAQMGITPRMVRSRLEKIAVWLDAFDAKLHRQRGVGYSLQSNIETRHRIWRNVQTLSGGRLVLHAGERFAYLCVELLSSHQPLLIKNLCLEMHVSRTTVVSDLKKLERWLSKYNLTLNRRPNFGLWVQGEETQTRKAMADCLLETSGMEFLLEVISKGEPILQRPATNIFTQRTPNVDRLLDELALKKTSRWILSNPDLLSNFRDEALVYLILMLAISAKRIQAGNFITMLERGLESYPDLDWVRTSQELLDVAIAPSQKPLPRTEVIFIANLLQSLVPRRPGSTSFTQSASSLLMPSMRSDNLDSQHENPTTDPELTVLIAGGVNEFLAKVSTYLHPYLTVDQELFTNLCQHLEDRLGAGAFAAGCGGKVLDSENDLNPGIAISARNVILSNSLLKDIQSRYRLIYEISQTCAGALNNRLGVFLEEQELGFITLYLAAAMERLRTRSKKSRVIVVCNAGRATSLLLVNRLKAEFPNIEVTGVLTYLDLMKTARKELDCDLILSTIPIQIVGVDCLTVDPFLKASDIARIRSRLNEQAGVTRQNLDDPPHYGLCLCQLLPASMIQLKIQAHTIEELIEKASVPLLRCGAIETRYVQSMKQVFDEFGPYMVLWPGVALLHALPENGVRRPCMSLASLQEALAFGHAQNDPVDIAIVLGATDHRSHLAALSDLNRLIQDARAMSELRKSWGLYQVLGRIKRICSHGQIISTDALSGEAPVVEATSAVS